MTVKGAVLPSPERKKTMNMDTIESGLSLVKRIDQMLGDYTEEETQTGGYLIRARLGIILVLRWLEKYVSGFNITMYDMLEYAPKNVDFVQAIEECQAENITELSETMEQMDNLLTGMTFSWRVHIYSSISFLANDCRETAEMLAKEKNRSAEDAWIDGQIAFVQMFQEGPFKEEQDNFRELLNQLYDLAADREAYESGENGYWYVSILENELLPRVMRAVEGKTPFTKKENEVLRTLLKDMIVIEDPFHASDVTYVMDFTQGMQKSGKLQYLSMSCTDEVEGIYQDPYQYYPHRGLEMVLLDQMILYLDEKYPDFFKKMKSSRGW